MAGGKGRCHAGPKQWAHVLTDAQREVFQVCSGRFPAELRIHIAIAETRPLLLSIYCISHLALSAPRSTIVIGIDNEVTRWVLKKGHSPVDQLNRCSLIAARILAATACVLRPGRVNTHRILADAPTRTAEVHGCPALPW